MSARDVRESRDDLPSPLSHEISAIKFRRSDVDGIPFPLVSLRLDVSLPYHPPPFVLLALEIGGIFLGGAGDGIQAALLETLHQCGVRHGRPQLLVEERDNRRGCPLRGEETVPGHELESRQAGL